MAALQLAVAWLFCRFVARGNFLAYAVILWTFALRASVATLFATGNVALRTQGWIVASVLVLSVAWALYPALLRRDQIAGAPT